jgi:hypothetical protein
MAKHWKPTDQGKQDVSEDAYDRRSAYVSIRQRMLTSYACVRQEERLTRHASGTEDVSMR